MTNSPGIRRIALEEFTYRRAALRKAAREGSGDWAGDPANENATLWLAIALAAGVGRDLPADVCAAIEVRALFPYERCYLPRADQVAEPRAYLGELAGARDAAIRKSEASPGNLRTEQRARDLIALAEALGAPGIDWSNGEQGRAAA